MPRTPESEEKARRIANLADGKRSATEIAELLGLNARAVRKVMTKLDLPRLPAHSPTGARNASFAGGRRIDRRGYAWVSAPVGHPYAPVLPGKNVPKILEHRLVLEAALGRYLLPQERVDHIDGLTLHNAPENLRLFSSNAEHLRATLTGKVPNWSDAGYQNMLLRHRQPEGLQRVDIHRQRTTAGAQRLRQILLLALRLGTESPFLSGTTRHTKKAGIDMTSRSTIERALAQLEQQWGWARSP